MENIAILELCTILKMDRSNKNSQKSLFAIYFAVKLDLQFTPPVNGNFLW